MQDYTDEAITRYSRYVRRTATLAPSTGAQTLAFRQWFRRTFQMEPGRYISPGDTTPPSPELTR